MKLYKIYKVLSNTGKVSTPFTNFAKAFIHKLKYGGHVYQLVYKGARPKKRLNG